MAIKTLTMKYLKDVTLICSLICCFISFACSVLQAQPVVSSAPQRIDVDSLTFPSSRYKIAPFKRPARKKIGFVFSGGGSRGLSQIGVLKAFEEECIPIDFIAGTSIGAIVGGLYAEGYSAAEMENLGKVFNWGELTSFQDNAKRRDVFLEQKKIRDKSFLTLRFDSGHLVIPRSLSSAQRLTETLDKLMLNARYHANPSFDHLAIPYRAVATDLVSGKSILLSEGSVSEAMRASSAVPLLFEPIRKGEMQLVDGGLLNNVPVNIAHANHCDMVIAVNSAGTLAAAQDVGLPWQAADQVMSIMMQEKNTASLVKADVVIEPNLGNINSAEFGNIDTLVQIGYAAGKSKIAQVKAAMQQPQTGDVPQANLHIERRFMQPASERLAKKTDSLIALKRPVKATLAALLETDYFTDAYALLDGETLTFVLTPNKIFSSVVVCDNKQVSDSTEKAAVAPLVARLYTHTEETQSLEALIKSYRDRGLPLARFESISVSGDTLCLAIDEGILDSIKIDGLNKTQRDVVERELAFNKSPMTMKEVESAFFGLYNTNLFSRVSIGVDETASQQPMLDIKISERYTDLLRLGLRIDNTNGTQLSLDLREESFRGHGSELGFSGIFGSRNFTNEIEYRNNRLWNSYFTFFASAFITSQKIEDDRLTFSQDESIVKPEETQLGEYAEQQYGFTFALGRQIERDGVAVIELTRKNSQVFQVLQYNNYQLRIPTSNFWTTTLKLRFTFDTRNEFSFPTNGNMLNAYYQIAPAFLASGIHYSKLLFEYQTVSTVADVLSLICNYTGGFADVKLPFIETFAMGGMDSFFGLPMDYIRGRQVLIGGFEVRYKLPFRLVFDPYFSVHYNIGNVWEQPQDVKFKDLLQGVAVDFKLNTPIGPARIAYGRAFRFVKDLPNNPISGGPAMLYISVGYQF
jgi:NTE family protein